MSNYNKKQTIEFRKICDAINGGGYITPLMGWAATCVLCAHPLWWAHVNKKLNIFKNNFSKCDAAIFATFASRLLLMQNMSSQDCANVITNELIVSVAKGAAYAFGIKFEVVRDMMNNRMSFYDEFMTEEGYDFSERLTRLLYEFGLILRQSITENTYIPYSRTSPLYVADIFETFKLEVEARAFFEMIHKVFTPLIDDIIK